MSGFWNCAFIGEGPSDDNLSRPLEGLVMSLVPGDDVRVEAARLPRRLRHAPAAEKIAEMEAWRQLRERLIESMIAVRPYLRGALSR